MEKIKLTKMFIEKATEHLKETYKVDRPFVSDIYDPLEARAQFLLEIHRKEEYAYLFDDKVPEILIEGITGFEDVAQNIETTSKFLLHRPLLESLRPSRGLPEIISPFSSEIFKGKPEDFKVNIGNLIKETDDPVWLAQLDKAFNFWIGGEHSFMLEITSNILIELETSFPGITIPLLKSCFVSSFLNLDLAPVVYAGCCVGEYDVDDLWDIFGNNLDIWSDYYNLEK